MNKYNIPTAAQQAFKIMDMMIAPDDIIVLRTMSPDEFSANQHRKLGQRIRNNWINISAGENEEKRMLLDKCYRMLAGKLLKNHFVHPDEVSSYFLKRYHRHLIRCQFYESIDTGSFLQS